MKARYKEYTRDKKLLTERELCETQCSKEILNKLSLLSTLHESLDTFICKDPWQFIDSCFDWT